MTIYVDPLVKYGKLSWKSCHMMTDGKLEELHQTANRIGLKPEWFQDHPVHPHYDLAPKFRELAIKAGAKAVTSGEMLQRCRRKAADTIIDL